MNDAVPYLLLGLVLVSIAVKVGLLLRHALDSWRAARAEERARAEALRKARFLGLALVMNDLVPDGTLIFLDGKVHVNPATFDKIREAAGW